MWDDTDKKGMLKDENSTEMFSYQKTALRVHLNTILAVKNAVDSSLLVWRKEERVVRMEGRCRWNSDGKKREKRREEALKRERNTASSKLACSNQRRSPWQTIVHPITPTQHDPTVLTFMVAFTLRPLSHCAAVLLMSWLLIDFCVESERREQQRLGWWRGVGEEGEEVQ